MLTTVELTPATRARFVLRVFQRAACALAFAATGRVEVARDVPGVQFVD